MVTRLNGSCFAVNPDLIARAHASPDSTLVLVDGSSYTVTESLEQLSQRIVDYRARVIVRAQQLASEGDASRPPLEPVALHPGRS